MAGRLLRWKRRLGPQGAATLLRQARGGRLQVGLRKACRLGGLDQRVLKDVKEVRVDMNMR